MVDTDLLAPRSIRGLEMAMNKQEHTMIVRTNPKIHPTTPYICHGVNGEMDATCPSFQVALQRVREMGLRAASCPKDDAPQDAQLRALQAGVELILI